MWIKHIVDGIIDEFNTRDVYKIIDLLDITLIKKELPLHIKGQFQRDFLGNEYIYVSSELQDNDRRVVLAHELGHAMLHTDLNINYYTKDNLISKNKLERQANKFAAELLIPDIEDIDIKQYESFAINDIILLFNVPKYFVELKFNIF